MGAEFFGHDQINPRLTTLLYRLLQYSQDITETAEMFGDSLETFKEKEVFKCFQEIAVPVLEGTVKFARRIPDFSTLTMAEQIALMKQNSYCVTLILLHVLFEDKTLYLCGRQPMLSVTRSKEEYISLEAEWLFEGIFSIAQKLLSMHLTLVEVALYSAAVLLLGKPLSGLRTNLCAVGQTSRNRKKTRHQRTIGTDLKRKDEIHEGVGEAIAKLQQE
ncbi:hypothetical protein CHS0354_032718 [Potamilus streckersoni]|uniref:NR LBD domain-containing protein n=1 Tax=Potamilus streckersoni TaxID=2493646 RepID=A0AAE0VH49_9BIVA|nr:hypothetical protein CHS0354_032718 [Potamilus streckersoni]